MIVFHSRYQAIKIKAKLNTQPLLYISDSIPVFCKMILLLAIFVVVLFYFVCLFFIWSAFAWEVTMIAKAQKLQLDKERNDEMNEWNDAKGVFFK